MCGIVGMLEETTVGDIHALTEIEAMLATVAHRGPDAQAVQQVPGATMGHARLAIVGPEKWCPAHALAWNRRLHCLQR